MSEKVLEKFPAYAPEKVHEKVPKYAPEHTPEKAPEKCIEYCPEHALEKQKRSRRTYSQPVYVRGDPSGKPARVGRVVA